jgi:hypothetical protein
MQTTIKELKQLAEECVEFGLTLNKEWNHSNICPEISLYVRGDAYSISFNEDYFKKIIVQLYSNTISFSMDTTKEDLQETLIKCRLEFENFKTSCLTKTETVNED